MSMIERRPGLTVLSHLVLILGVLIVAFPVYVTIIASTQTTAQIVQNTPMSLWPGDHALETYRLALFGGACCAPSERGRGGGRSRHPPPARAPLDFGLSRMQHRLGAPEPPLPL